MRVITFSKYFPAYHPRKGEPTFFVEKIWKGDVVKVLFDSIELRDCVDNYTNMDLLPKYHTIRVGNRWKAGDYFSPRVWGGKPYASKQIEFAPPIEIKKVFDVEIENNGFQWHVSIPSEVDGYRKMLPLDTISKNDGLGIKDFCDWFNVHQKKKDKIFKGQIICWNKNINY